MRNDYKSSNSQPGSQHGSQQAANAGNQLEGQLDRLKGAFNIAPGRGTDGKLAHILGLTHQSISIWRQKGIPGKRLKEICQDQKILMDWLLTGEGPMRREEYSIGYERSSQKPGIKDNKNPFPGAESLVEGIKTIFNQSGIDMFKTESLLMFHLLVDLFVRELKKRGIE